VLQRWPVEVLVYGRPQGIKEEPHLIEHILQLELRKSRALDILDSAKILGHALAIFFSYRLHFLLTKLLAHLRVVTQIGLGANNETRHARAVVVDLGEPFFPDVLETGR
jgi:hypothetical protein